MRHIEVLRNCLANQTWDTELMDNVCPVPVDTINALLRILETISQAPILDSEKLMKYLDDIEEERRRKQEGDV